MIPAVGNRRGFVGVTQANKQHGKIKPGNDQLMDTHTRFLPLDPSA